MHVDLSPARAMRHSAVANPDRTVIVHGAQRIVAADLVTRVDDLARLLSRLGVTRGDRVALVARNCPDHFLGFLACAQLGAVFVPVNFRLAVAEIEHVLASCRPRVVLAAAEQLAGPCARDLVARSSTWSTHAPHWLVLDDGDGGAADAQHLDACRRGDVGEVGYLPTALEVARRTGARPPEPVACGEDDLALLIYTSGTTGHPKGVRLTHGNLWWCARNTQDALDVAHADVTLAAAPLAHVGALITFALQTLTRGGTVVTMRAFEAGAALGLIERERVSTMFGVPGMYGAMARHPDFARRDLSSLRVPLVGGAPVPEPLLRDYRARGVTLLHSWGMTETAAGGTYLPPSYAASRPTSIGIPFPYTRIRLRDRDGVVVTEPDVVGEMCVSSPTVTAGYWEDPAGTAAAFDGGWLRTGDLATWDEHGFLHLVGRLKDVIISSGENIYPAEVENVLAGHPDVQEVAAVGVPDAQWGETVLVFVVPRPGSEPTLEDLRTWATGRLARYKLPRHLVLLDHLPTGTSGKVDVHALRERGARLVAATS